MVEFREKLFGFYIGAYTRKIEFNENFGREIFKKSFGWVLPQMVKKEPEIVVLLRFTRNKLSTHSKIYRTI